MISVVIPVYNAEKTIAQTIESVLGQSLDDFEVILIDDGSTDDSLRICRDYEGMSEKCKVYSFPNGGVSAARKRGVEKSNGTWITFVDADDLLPRDALFVLSKQIGSGADVIVGNAEFWDNSFQTKKVNPVKVPYEMLLSMMYLKRLLGEQIICAPWGKLFKKSLFVETIFDLPRSIVNGEDLIMNLRLGVVAAKIVCIPDIVYDYRAPTVSHGMTFTQQINQLRYVCSSVRKHRDLQIYAVYKWFYRKVRKLLLKR